MKVPSAVKPGLVVESRYIDHQSVAFPAAHRPTHVTIGRSLLHFVQMDDTAGAGKFVGDYDLVVPLNDLERKGHVCRARDTRKITLGFRVQRFEPDTVRVDSD